jgi:hypothetical protein
MTGSALATVLLGLSGLCLAGCASDRDHDYRAESSGRAVTAGNTGGVGPTDELPLSVSAAFHRDFPNAGVTHVVRGSTETGQPIYRVTFIDQGIPSSETYFVDGTRLPRGATGSAVGGGRAGSGANPAVSAPGANTTGGR